MDKQLLIICSIVCPLSFILLYDGISALLLVAIDTSLTYLLVRYVPMLFKKRRSDDE